MTLKAEARWSEAIERTTTSTVTPLQPVAMVWTRCHKEK